MIYEGEKGEVVVRFEAVVRGRSFTIFSFDSKSYNLKVEVAADVFRESTKRRRGIERTMILLLATGKIKIIQLLKKSMIYSQ